MDEYTDKIIELLKEKSIKDVDGTGLLIDVVEIHSAINAVISVIGYKG